MAETPLKEKLTQQMRALLPDYFIVERNEDKIISGRPDICVIGLKVTSRWEVKHANPGFKHKGIQTDTMLKLANAGFAWYIVFDEPTQRIYIVDPMNITKPKSTWKDFTEGYDYKWVVQRVWQVHYYDRNK